jgi:hypothetical protein
MVASLVPFSVPHFAERLNRLDSLLWVEAFVAGVSISLVALN